MKLVIDCGGSNGVRCWWRCWRWSRRAGFGGDISAAIGSTRISKVPRPLPVAGASEAVAPSRQGHSVVSGSAIVAGP